MSSSSRARSVLIVVLLLLLALLVLLFLGRCTPATTAPVAQAVPEAPATGSAHPAPPAKAEPPAAAPGQPAEVLTAATVVVPAQVMAGATFLAGWTGPNNAGDYLTIVRPGATAATYDNYQETSRGAELELTAPIEPGDWEVRYVAVRSKTVLGQAALVVTPVGATLAAAGEVVAGGAFAVTWAGPKNAGDYLTVVPKGTPDGQYRNYMDAAKGSPLELTAPIEPGDAEIRYMSGQGAKVLARRALRVTAAAVTIEAPAEAIAGAPIAVTWTGPKNAGDYLTLVPKTMRDGQYGNYTDAAKGSPLHVTAPIQPGAAEIRYMSGQGAKVLARRSIEIVAAQVRLTAPTQATAGGSASIEWVGPNNSGDYLTIVAKTAKDGAMHRMTMTSRGSPVKVDVPKEAGAHEVRYMSGQGNLVLARAEIEVR